MMILMEVSPLCLALESSRCEGVIVRFLRATAIQYFQGLRRALEQLNCDRGGSKRWPHPTQKNMRGNTQQAALGKRQRHVERTGQLDSTEAEADIQRQTYIYRQAH